MPPRCCWPMPAPRRARMRCRPGWRRPRIQGAPTLHQSAQPPIGAKPIHIDPELLTLYIEEAREEVARIAKLFPAWEQNPLETDALAGVRRAFHTLKGSGRMVGATDISEFAWAIENLLNKIIENTLQRSPAILATMRDAVRHRRRTGERARGRQGRARARAGHRRSRACAGRQQGRRRRADRHHGNSRAHARYAPRRRLDATGRVPTLQAAPAAPQCRRDTAERRRARSKSSRTGRSTSRTSAGEEHRAVGARRGAERRSAAARDLQPRDPGEHRRGAALRRRPSVPRSAPHVVSEEAYRACHTLSGSSRMAEARHGIRLTAPLEHWVRKSFDSGVGLEARISSCSPIA